MKAFVTGATGLLGSNLVHALLARGDQVKALVRSREKAGRVFSEPGIEFITGDMRNVEAFAPALAGCDALFHTAAYFREYYQPGDHADMRKINVEGTLKLLALAEKHGIRRAVYVSSAGVIGMKPDGSPGDETTPPDEIAGANLYFRSKVEAEEELAKFLAQHSIAVVQILPAWIFGPSDSAPTASGQLVLDFLNRKLPGVVGGGSSIVDARDVAEAMIRAAEKGASSERYIIGGSYFEFGDVLRALEKVTGVPGPQRHIPYGFSLVVAWCSEKWSQVTGKPALVTLSAVQTIHARKRVDSSKAVREFGIHFRPLEETLRDEVEWFRRNGFVGAAPAAGAATRAASAAS